MYPFLNPQSRDERNLLEKRCSWLNNILSKIFETVGSVLMGLILVSSNESPLLNKAIISAIFSSFGNLLCFIHSLMQFARSLQIYLFASFTILIGIAPLVFLVESIEFMILEMPSRLTKLKSNNCVISTDDLILIMLG